MPRGAIVLVEQQVVTFIRDALQRKYSRSEIEQALLKKGWTSAQVQEAFASISSSAQASSVKKVSSSVPFYKTTWFLVLIVALILLTTSVIAYLLFFPAEKVGCVSDRDCSSGEECNSGDCVAAPPECSRDSDCSSGEECNSGSCVVVPECSRDSDCLSTETCSSGSCVAISEAVTCVDDTDCVAGYSCTSGQCVLPEEVVSFPSSAQENYRVSGIGLGGIASKLAVFGVNVSNVGDSSSTDSFTLSCSMSNNKSSDVSTGSIEVQAIDARDSSLVRCAVNSSSLYTLLLDSPVVNITLVAVADAADDVDESNESDNSRNRTFTVSLSDFSETKFAVACSSDGGCVASLGSGFVCDSETSLCLPEGARAFSLCASDGECSIGYACGVAGVCLADVNLNGVVDSNEVACNDGVDSDGDGSIDFTGACDTDSDGVVDYNCFGHGLMNATSCEDTCVTSLLGSYVPADSSCTQAVDTTEDVLCGSDVDCREGYTCSADKCLPFGFVRPCPETLPTCADGVDNDGDGLVDLADESCRDTWVGDESTVLPECSRNSDCSSGEECDSGACVPVEPEVCTSDGDCGRDEVCADGSCVALAQELSCDGDSDGEDPFTEGYASEGLGGFSLDDTCYDSSSLLESYCLGSGDPLQWKAYTCTDGCASNVCESADAEEVICNGDSDGDDPFVSGYAGEGESGLLLSDSCSDDTHLLESYCAVETSGSSESYGGGSLYFAPASGEGTSEPLLYQKVYSCAYGCQEGVCLKQEAECSQDSDCSSGEECDSGICVVVPECSVDSDCSSGEKCISGACVSLASYLACDSDSDGGLDTLSFGSAAGIDDVCYDSKNLFESSCSSVSGSDVVQQDLYVCSGGCSEGSCSRTVGKKASCSSDSDSDDPFVAGSASSSSLEVSDTCLDSSTLQEVFCDGGDVSSLIYECPYGCYVGKCLESEPPECSDGIDNDGDSAQVNGGVDYTGACDTNGDGTADFACALEGIDISGVCESYCRAFSWTYLPSDPYCSSLEDDSEAYVAPSGAPEQEKSFFETFWTFLTSAYDFVGEHFGVPYAGAPSAKKNSWRGPYIDEILAQAN